MSVILTGKVFNDLNHTGIYSSLYPGIAYLLIGLICPDQTLQTTQTDQTGTYTFYELNLPGDYTLLEITYSEDEKSLPLLFDQPLGLIGSTTVRKHLLTITEAQILEGVSIDTLHFGHDVSQPFSSTELAYTYNPKEFSLDALNLITGEVQWQTKLNFNSSFKILGFNPLDYFIYGYCLDEGQILRLSADGMVVTYSIKYLPHKQFTVGDINHRGHLYLYEPLDNLIYIVDINPHSPTYMYLLDPHQDLIAASSSTGYSFKPLDISTCCFGPHTSLFYAIDSKGHLISINIPLNETTYLITTGTPPCLAHTIMCDFEGYLYCLFKDISFIYRITLSDTSAMSEIFSPLSSSHLLGGVRCYNSPTYIQLGSAPDSSPLNGSHNYNTLLAHNGPRHGITNILFFGKEDLSYLELKSLSITEGSYKLSLPITNHTGQDAYLYGWIDFNNNGLFEPHEAASPLLIPHTLEGIVTFSLIFSVPQDTHIVLGDTYIRLRLTTDTLALDSSSKLLEDSRALGPASDGQILDLPLTILAPAPTTTGPTYSFCEVNKNLSDVAQIEDPSFGNLHYVVETPPHHGLADIHPHMGKWNYKPYANFVGEDTFTIRATSSRSHLHAELPIFVSVQKADLKVSTTPICSEYLPGDTVTYTTTIENIGTVPITDLIYTHPLTPDVSFVLSSVYINDISDRSARPEHGINLHKLSPGEICILTFQITLTSSSKEFLSQGLIKGTYTIASHHEAYTKEGNITKLLIKSPNLFLDLSSNLPDAFLEDTLQYTVRLTNKGDLALQHINLLLHLPPELQYEHQLIMDHIQLTDDLCSGYTISNLAPHDTVALQFTAKVLNTSDASAVHTTIFASYSYALNGEVKTSKNLSAQCALNICIPNIEFTTQFDKQTISLGETFSYTLTAINRSAFLIESITLKDFLPDDVHVIDIYCDNKPIPNKLDMGLSLDKLAPLHTTKVTIRLKLLSMPATKQLAFPSTIGIFTLSPAKFAPPKLIYLETSPAPLPITDAALHLHKSISTEEAAVGEVITYTITLTNSGTIVLSQVTLRDLLCPELKFVADSIILDDRPLLHTSLMSGVVIETLLPNQSKTLRFDCLILDRGQGILENTCSAYYTYKPHHSTSIRSGSTSSNMCPLMIRQAYLDLSGNVNKSMTFLDDRLSYTIVITNTGDMDAFNVLLHNRLEACELIDGSFMINDLVIHSIDFLNPINVGHISKGQSVYIRYEAKVVGHCHFEDTLTNVLSISFAYTTMDQCIKYDKSKELDLSIPLALSTFKQLSLDNFLEVPCHEPDMELINTIGGQISLLKNYVIDTPVGVSSEGQKLSGKKLVIHALLELTAEYVSATPTQSIHSIYCTIPFSTFIVLPKTCTAQSLMHIDATIDNISFKVLSNRSFFTNSSIFLVARIK